MRPSRAELDGVADQVLQHLREPVLIAPDIGQVVGELQLQVDRSGQRQRPLWLDGVEDQLARRHARVIDAQLSRLDQRHVQQVVDQTVHPAGGSQNAVDRFLVPALGLAAAAFHHRRLHDDRGRRVSQIMRDDAQDLVPQLRRAQRGLVQPTVFDRERRKLGDGVREAQIVRPIGPRGRGRHENQHADQLPADRERQPHDRLRVDRAQNVEVLLALRERRDRLRRHPFHQIRPPGLQDGARQVRQTTIDPQLFQRGAQPGGVGPRAHHLDPRRPVSVLDDVHDAPVRKIADHQLPERRQCLLVVERRRQQRAGLREEPLFVLDALSFRDRPLSLGDVAGKRLPAAARKDVRAHLDRHHGSVLSPVPPLARVRFSGREQRGTDSGQSGHVLGVDDVGDRLREQLVALVAQHPAGGLVDVHEATIEIREEERIRRELDQIPLPRHQGLGGSPRPPRDGQEVDHDERNHHRRRADCEPKHIRLLQCLRSREYPCVGSFLIRPRRPNGRVQRVRRRARNRSAAKSTNAVARRLATPGSCRIWIGTGEAATDSRTRRSFFAASARST